MKFRIVAPVVIMILTGCSRRQASNGPSGSRTGESGISTARTDDHGRDKGRLSDQSKPSISNIDIHGDVWQNVLILQQLTKEFEIEKNLSHAEALNELYIILAENQPVSISLSIKGIFARVLQDDPKKQNNHP